MKAIKLILISFVISVPFCFSQTKKANYNSSKQKELIEVANMVCKTLAPDFEYSKLTPVVFECNDYNNKWRNDTRKYVRVYFMEDTAKYDNLNSYEFKTNKIIATNKRPIGKLSVVILVDSLKPISIMTSEAGFEFLPDYDTFVKKHSDYRIKPNESIKMPYSEDELNSFRVK